MLNGAGYKAPDKVFVHGYVTVNGAKMSKSKGTFIKASTYLKHFTPECLRYYYAAKMNGRIDDLDLNLDDFIAKVNSDIVNKLVNLASRTAGFITKIFGGKLADSISDESLLDMFDAKKSEIEAAYQAREYSRAIREIMALADEANRYVDEKAPWVAAKDESRRAEFLSVTSCQFCLNLPKKAWNSLTLSLLGKILATVSTALKLSHLRHSLAVSTRSKLTLC